MKRYFDNKMNKILVLQAIPFFITVTVILLASCGSAGLAAPEKPVAADPDPENPNRIELSWKAVDGADIYYVYRSTSETGSYVNSGFSVTYNEIEADDGGTEIRYSYIESFDEGNGGTYWYKITAATAEASGTVESGMSPAGDASTYSGTWGAAKDLGAAGQLKLVAGLNSLYALYSAEAGSDVINMQIYAEGWTAAASPGTTDGGENGPFTVFLSGGELYTVFSDSPAPASGAVSIQYYQDPGTGVFAWEAVGAEGFNGAAASGLSAAAVGFAGDIYSAFIETGGGEVGAQLYKNNEEIDLLALIGPIDVASNLRLVSHNNNLYFGYEYTDGLYLREYDTVFETLDTGGQVTTSDIDDGNIVFVSGGGSLYAVYIEVGGTEVIVQQLIGDVWMPVATTGELVTTDSAAYGALTAHWFNGYLYVFYIDTDAGGTGWVKYYDADDGWLNAQRIGGAAVTGSTGLKAFQLASSGNTLYAGWIEGGNAYVRILE